MKNEKHKLLSMTPLSLVKN